MLLAPLDGFHEQILAVPTGHDADGLQCGWHGDLDEVHSGFRTTWYVRLDDRPRAVLEHWGRDLRRFHAAPRPPSRYADALLSHLSYWTDNGSAYWYRTEPGLDMEATLAHTVDELRGANVPIRAVEVDSWFYPHEHSRPLNLADDVIVPPTGALRWEPREDVLPNGVSGLRKRLGAPPLVLHGRHFSSRSPYFSAPGSAWIDGDRAHPRDPDFFRPLLGQAAAWGAISYEQDWLVECFLGVRGLRAAPGRARLWQEGLDAAAREHGLSLLWCMATPADACQAALLERVVAIRTSGDYRYIVGNRSLWCWFLYGNALARALGLLPFKDVFLSARDGSGLDGDPHAEIEALLASLSTGPVGIGDRRGRTDADLLDRCTRRDGLLLKPDVPVAALDRCLGRHAHIHGDPMVAESHSTHDAGRWHYVVSLNASQDDRTIATRVQISDLADALLAPPAAWLCYDWRTTRCEIVPADGGWDLSLTPGAWDYRVLCPLLASGLALVGDPSVYATAADRRIRAVRVRDAGLELEVLGAPGERVTLRGFCRDAGVRVEVRDPGAASSAAVRPGASVGAFDVSVTLPEIGRLPLRIERGDPI